MCSAVQSQKAVSAPRLASSDTQYRRQIKTRSNSFIFNI